MKEKIIGRRQLSKLKLKVKSSFWKLRNGERKRKRVC